VSLTLTRQTEKSERHPWTRTIPHRHDTSIPAPEAGLGKHIVATLARVLGTDTAPASWRKGPFRRLPPASASHRVSLLQEVACRSWGLVFGPSSRLTFALAFCGEVGESSWHYQIRRPLLVTGAGALDNLKVRSLAGIWMVSL
jgi:hypothetical protein